MTELFISTHESKLKTCENKNMKKHGPLFSLW